MKMTDHPVDILLAMGCEMTTEQEAQLRAYCDEPIQGSEATYPASPRPEEPGPTASNR